MSPIPVAHFSIWNCNVLMTKGHKSYVFYGEKSCLSSFALLVCEWYVGRICARVSRSVYKHISVHRLELLSDVEDCTKIWNFTRDGPL